MMKNFDLIWARDWAGLTQEQAAEKMGVHRVTLALWESGERQIPPRKWQRFLKCVAINPQDIPKHSEPQGTPTRPEHVESQNYDAAGFPVGFDRTPYAETKEHLHWREGEAEALKKFEGDEYPARERERYRSRETCGNPKRGIPPMDAAVVARFMAEFDEEQRQLAARKKPRSYYMVHPSARENLRYDSRGDPVGFYRTLYGEDYPLDGSGPESAADDDARDAALEKIEGEEYPARCRERYRLMFTNWMLEEGAARYMAEYDEEQRRLVAGMPERSDKEIHPGDYRSEEQREEEREEARAAEEKRMLAWQRDPEGMAAEARVRNAKKTIGWRTDPARLEEAIKKVQDEASCWFSGEDVVRECSAPVFVGH